MQRPLNVQSVDYSNVMFRSILANSRQNEHLEFSWLLNDKLKELTQARSDLSYMLNHPVPHDPSFSYFLSAQQSKVDMKLQEVDNFISF